MKHVFVIVSCLVFVVSAMGGDTLRVASNASWSQRIAESFLLRHPNAVTYDTGFTEQKWNYEQGLMLVAFHEMWKHTGDEKYFTFIRKNLDQYIDQDGTIKLYNRLDYNLDLVAPGRPLLWMYEATREPKFRAAADSLRRQLSEQPRTLEGGFWHKKIYPYQMWLDGLFMAAPFYAMYTQQFGDAAAFDDIANQFIWVGRHTRDKKTGLYYHGWDESKKMPWADSVSGHSPCFWGRAMGWYAMGLVDVLDYIPANHPQRKRLIAILNDVCGSLLKWRDKKANLWYLILDQKGREGNYLESSASCMFTYAFAKGANRGYLDKKYLREARRSFDAILKHHITVDANGFVNLHNTIKGAGLGGKPYRDGSFSYYTSEAQRTNDMKGLGPLLRAAIELETKSR